MLEQRVGIDAWAVFCLLTRVLVQQQPERRRRATARPSFRHVPSSKRPACWRFAARGKTRKRISPSNSRRLLPSPSPRWLNLPWRLAKTTQSGSSARTGPCFRYWPLRSSFAPNSCSGHLIVIKVMCTFVILAVCPTGCKAAAGVTSQPHNRVSGPHT